MCSFKVCGQIKRDRRKKWLCLGRFYFVAEKYRICFGLPVQQGGLKFACLRLSSGNLNIIPVKRYNLFSGKNACEYFLGQKVQL